MYFVINSVACENQEDNGPTHDFYPQNLHTIYLGNVKVFNLVLYKYPLV